MIKAILFDADGMIIDSPVFSTSYTSEYNLPPHSMDAFFQTEFEQCKLGHLDLKEVLPKYFKQWKWENTVEEFLNRWFLEIQVNYEMIDIISELRSINIFTALATNQEQYRLKYIKEEHQLEQKFDKIIASCDVRALKPSPDYYRQVLKILDTLSKEQILFWDNKQENVDEAIKFGFKAELYSNFADFKQKVYKYLELEEGSAA